MKLFGNPDILEEKPSDYDALEYSKEVNNVVDIVKRLVSNNKHSIIAYLGAFGVGKSTILREAAKATPDFKWVTFEMWRYANRNDLWDNFVIKITSEISDKKDELSMADEVEGEVASWKNDGRKILLLITAAMGLSICISFLAWLILRDAGSINTQFIRAYLKYAFPVTLTVLALLGLGSFIELNFTNKRPLRRVFELENLLKQKLKGYKKPIVVVVEDADRSEPDGFVFLETLNNFLNNYISKQDKAFIVIAPQSTTSFDRFEEQVSKGLERSLKIYDEKMYFSAQISDESINKFYTEAKVADQYKDKLIKATSLIIGKHRNYITIRLLKHALRELNNFMRANPAADPTISLSIILSKYVSLAAPIGGRKMLASTILMGSDEHQSGAAKEFFLALAIGVGNYDEVSSISSFIFKTDPGVKDPTASLFTHGSGSVRCTFILPSLYEALR